jgi:hypothetical protein
MNGEQKVTGGVVRADARNAIEDLLWVAEPSPQILVRTRRDLDLDEFLPAYERFKALLHQLWVLGDDTDYFFTPSDGCSLSPDIDRHVRSNPGDWTAEYLFEQLGAFDAVNRRFALFLEGLVSAQTLPGEDAQRRVTAVCDKHLHRVGLDLCETGEADGRPARGGRRDRLLIGFLPANVTIGYGPRAGVQQDHDAPHGRAGRGAPLHAL